MNDLSDGPVESDLTGDVCNSLRRMLLEWLGQRITDGTHVFEDYTEIYVEGRPASMPGSERVVLYRGKSAVCLRVIHTPVEDAYYLVSLEETHSSFAVRDKRPIDPADPDVAQCMGRLAMQWFGESWRGRRHW